MQSVARSAAGARGTFALPEPRGALPHAELLSTGSGTSAEEPKSSHIFHEFPFTCQFFQCPKEKGRSLSCLQLQYYYNPDRSHLTEVLWTPELHSCIWISFLSISTSELTALTHQSICKLLYLNCWHWFCNNRKKEHHMPVWIFGQRSREAAFGKGPKNKVRVDGRECLKLWHVGGKGFSAIYNAMVF